MREPGETSDQVGWFDATAMSILRRVRSSRHPLAVLVALFVGLLLFPLPVLVFAGGIASLFGTLLLLPGIAFGLVILRGLNVSTQYGEAYARGDIDEAGRLRRLMEGSGPPRTPFERANRQLGDAEHLLFLERWAEARDAFAQIDREALPAPVRPGLLSQQAYAAAHAGQPDVAIEQIERAMKEANEQADYPHAKRWFLNMRVGVALSLAGRHDDAISVLGDVLGADGGELREWTAANFFLGQSLRASGNFDDAMASLEVAAREGEGPFAARAKVALHQARTSPLRDGGPTREPRAEAVRVVEEEESEGEPVPVKARRARRP